MPFDPRKQRTSAAVVAVECVTGTLKTGIKSGDIVEEIRIEGSTTDKVAVSVAPFRNGRRGVQKLLRESSKREETSIVVKVRRGADNFVELQACIVPAESSLGRRREYVIRSVDDLNFTASFVDRTEEECFRLQGIRLGGRAFSELSKARVEDGYMFYSWEKKMKDSAVLEVSGSSSLLSFLVLPKSTADATNPKYNCMEDTLARANAWLNSSQASGVPIVFMNVQAETMLTKISGETASCSVNFGSLSDLANLANSSLYGLEDYHGVDIGVMRAVRLWYTPAEGEYGIEIELKEGDTKLGFAVSRTDEGFIYISSVSTDDETEDLPSTRSGLRDLYQEATKASRLLVISRVSNEKILPWMASTSGAIRCFDTVSLSQKLSLHRHAVRPIQIHVLMWDRNVSSPCEHSDHVMDHMQSLDLADSKLVGDAAGESSFRFTDYTVVPNNRVYQI